MTLLGATIPGLVVPEPGDLIEIEAITYVIVDDGVARDPAAATYACHCRAT